MYRHRTPSSSGFTLVVLLGIILGVGYLIHDNWQDVSPIASPNPVPRPLLRDIEPEIVPIVQQATAPEIPREITSGAIFFAPTAGIRTRIVQSYLNGESWDVDNLGSYAGHLQGTAWINQPGNVVLAGHAEVFSGAGGIFSAIAELNVGDPLIITQDGSEYRYNVVEKRYVEPDDLTPFYPTEVPRLTLTTCSNYDLLQNTYQERYVVIAERVV